MLWRTSERGDRDARGGARDRGDAGARRACASTPDDDRLAKDRLGDGPGARDRGAHRDWRGEPTRRCRGDVAEQPRVVLAISDGDVRRADELYQEAHRSRRALRRQGHASLRPCERHSHVAGCGAVGRSARSRRPVHRGVRGDRRNLRRTARPSGRGDDSRLRAGDARRRARRLGAVLALAREIRTTRRDSLPCASRSARAATRCSGREDEARELGGGSCSRSPGITSTWRQSDMLAVVARTLGIVTRSRDHAARARRPVEGRHARRRCDGDFVRVPPTRSPASAHPTLEAEARLRRPRA